MKNIARVCIILMVAFFVPQKLFPATLEEEHLKDSLLQTACNIPNVSLRSKYLRNMFQRYIGKEWSAVFLDHALTISSKNQLHSEELAACFDYLRFYQFRGDIQKMEHWVQTLKDASYKYKNYDFYFHAWNIMLQSKSALGDTEYVIMETKKMEKEATQLNFKAGIYLSKITLAQAYYFSGKADEGIVLYKQVLTYPELNAKSKILVHGQLANYYQGVGEYKQAIHELKQQRAVIDQLIREDAENRFAFKNNLLEIELSFCRIYIDMENKKELKRHLDIAKRYYTEDCFFSYYIGYHSYWGAYYCMIKDWENCFKEFDLSLSRFQGEQPLYENIVRNMKAYAMMVSGRLKEAAEIYRDAAMAGDSLNREVLKRHEEVHRANYKIQRALLDRGKTVRRYRLIAIAASVLVLVIFIFVILRTLRIQMEMRRSEQQIRNALHTVTAANKLKEVFLKNITYEIRIPLNAVVGLSELLSVEKDLTEEEIQEYSAIIKTNSEKLLLLINNVLDLSRLEAGMMRFNVQAADAVQLCREAQMMLKMQDNNTVNAVFHTELKTLPFDVDTRWFLKLLSSVLSAPQRYNKEVETVEYTLMKANKELQITVKGSPLCKWTEDEQGQRIQHDINRLYLETFKGSYRLLNEEGEKTIVISYPV